MPFHQYHYNQSILLLLFLAILIFYFTIQPRAFKFYVNEAKLTQFNYTTKYALNYNLVLNFTARNPNKKLNIYYDKVEGHAFSEGTRFDTTDIIITGMKVIVLDHDQVLAFEEDKRNGIFDIQVQLYFTIRFRLGDFIDDGTKVSAKCELEVPLMSYNGTTVAAFQPTECHVKFSRPSV